MTNQEQQTANILAARMLAQQSCNDKSWHMMPIICNVAEPYKCNLRHLQGIDTIKAQQHLAYLAMMVVYVTATANITPEIARNMMEVRVPGPVLPSITSAMVWAKLPKYAKVTFQGNTATADDTAYCQKPTPVTDRA
jgi:hypothetical protein